jgi:hypothetical protein
MRCQVDAEQVFGIVDRKPDLIGRRALDRGREDTGGKRISPRNLLRVSMRFGASVSLLGSDPGGVPVSGDPLAPDIKNFS